MPSATPQLTMGAKLLSGPTAHTHRFFEMRYIVGGEPTCSKEVAPNTCHHSHCHTGDSTNAHQRRCTRCAPFCTCAAAVCSAAAMRTADSTWRCTQVAMLVARSLNHGPQSCCGACVHPCCHGVHRCDQVCTRVVILAIESIWWGSINATINSSTSVAKSVGVRTSACCTR